MVKKTDQYYKKILSDIQYQVTRCSATETPFSGKYCAHNEKGIYHCICCDSPLFSSKEKFLSSCGWPSFSAAILDDSINILQDHSHGMNREEARCTSCDAHLGHRFADGPPPAGIRYCINSVSIAFKHSPKKQSAIFNPILGYKDYIIISRYKNYLLSKDNAINIILLMTSVYITE